MLPVEILRLIAAESPESYRAMLLVPEFARSLDPGIIADYMILFGHTVKITPEKIVWRRNGRKHRVGGPAVENINVRYLWSTKCDGAERKWYRNGLQHRDDGPAVEYADGSTEWYRDGYHHRDDGPAIECYDPWMFSYMWGTGRTYELVVQPGRCWYRFGMAYRENGPTREHPDGRVYDNDFCAYLAGYDRIFARHVCC